MAARGDPDRNELSFNSAWNVFITKFDVGDSKGVQSFRSKSDALVNFWSFFVKEVPNKISESCQEKITDLIRRHQMHIISPLWVEDGNHEFRQKLLGILKSANQKLQGAITRPAYQEYLTVLELHKDPWTGPLILPILSGKPEPRSIDFLIGESYNICLHRLKLLLEGPSLMVAFNFVDFIVQNVCNSEKRTSSLIVQRWIQNAKDIPELIDAHLGLMFKLKKDTRLCDGALKNLDFEELVSAAERASRRREKLVGETPEQKQARLSSLESVWNPKTARKASEKLADFSMCVAAKRTLDQAVLERIIQNWLGHFSDPKDSDLDLDAEKFSELGIETGLAYEMATQILSKFGPSVRLMVLDTFVRALCGDINRLHVASVNKNTEGVKSAESTVSRGLVKLSKLSNGNLTFERECILTAFSLTPTDHLFKKVTELAERSGFVDCRQDPDDSVGKEEEKRLERVSVPFPFSDLDFESLCLNEELALTKGFSRGKSFRSAGKEKIHRNLEGLVSVQGDLLTEAANYNPIKVPLQTLTPKSLGLPKHLVSDLLTVIESPRWHLLSWILDWHTLEERCLNLKSKPEIKNPNQELKYLVIDYTQFDEWSSDEEVMASGGIEKGYEHWEKNPDNDAEAIEERGLSGDEAEVLEFNVVQKFDVDNPDPDDDEDILPEQYLPKRWRDYPEAAQPQPEADHFLAAVGETEAVRSDLAGSNTQSLLRNNSNSQEVRDKLKALVPGLDDSRQFSHSSEMDVGFVHVQFDVERRKNVAVTSSCSDVDPTSEFVREKLRKVVPGLCDFSFFEPVEHFRPVVGVVHVTLANSTAPSSSSSSAPTTAGNSQTRKIVLESTSQSTDQQNPTSTNNLQPSIPPKKEHETKIQYVYKHGNQTIVVDRPLTEEELSKLKFQLPNNRPQQQQPQAPQQAKQPIVVSRPSIASQQPVARLVVPPSPSAASSSVETLANTLISQIQTPVQLTPSGQPIKTEDQKPSPGTLPKFQFAFGSRDSNPVIKTEPGLVVKSEPLETTNGKILITSPTQQRPHVQQTSVSTVALKGTNLVSLPSKPAPQIVVQTSSASQSHLVSSQQVTLQASPSAASHADLIKQLNQARAQGLVVLQQWGDKQVLVHKATGRWIMRQGNRLVTVPPQALGIQASNSDQTSAGTATSTPPTSQSPTNNLMSTSTMEQLREFDSILESKFKTTTMMTASSSGDETRQVVATSSPATFVIITPQQQQQQHSNFVKCEPVAQEFNQVKASSSAPTSPSKPIKIPPSSASASASPLGNNSALGFAKPSPKPQEDPDTLKRIQQILDDYNEQIRNSPDLQNRPAPRRRTNGPTIINSGVTDSTKRKRLSSVSPPPSSGVDSSDVGSPSVVTAVQISSANVIDTNHVTLKVMQKPASENGNETTSSTTPTYSVVRQIVVPPSLAASLQASGRQIMVVTGPGGKKMVAVKPVFTGTGGGSPNIMNKFVAVSHGALPARLVTSTTTSSPSSSNASSPEISSTNSATMAKAIAALKNAVPISIGSSSITSLSSSTFSTSPSRTSITMMPTFMVASPQPSVVVTSPSIVLSNERASPNLILQSVGHEERPPTPGLGIPMEMTPGQIMEAEISAATLLDDNPDSPFALMSSASSSSLRRRKHEDEESLSETLPENLFTQDLPGTSSDEDDDYRNDLYGVTTTTTSNVYGKRQRHVSSTSSSEELSSQLQKRSRLDSRHRNLSQTKSKSSGAMITNGNVISSIFANDASQLINN